jgi:hypothetical protein
MAILRARTFDDPFEARFVIGSIMKRGLLIQAILQYDTATKCTSNQI